MLNECFENQFIAEVCENWTSAFFSSPNEGCIAAELLHDHVTHKICTAEFKPSCKYVELLTVMVV